MKKTALYILLVVLLKSSISFSQDSIPVKGRRFLYGFTISASMSHYIGDNANFSAVITSNTRYRHSLYLGPMLNGFSYGRNTWGMQGGYVFFPNLKQKRFDFLFFYDAKYVAYENSFWGNDPFIIEESYWQHTIGYGFHFNIIPNLYVNNNMGIGISNVKTKYQIARSGQKIYPAGVFNMGLGYTF